MAFQKYSEEKRNEILDSQQEKNARGKISLLLNLGFPKDWIEKMLPYINEDTTSWQLRMISLFDQDPEDLVAMLEDSVKNSSVEIFQSIRKKYYIEKKSSADIEQIQKSMEQYVPLIHNQLDAYNEMSALLQQQFAVQQEKDDLHKSKGDLQERINAMQKEHEKISIEKEDIFHQLQDSEKEKISIQQQLVDATESLQKSQGTAASYEKQIAILNNRIDELEKQLEVYQAKENEITQEEEKQLEHIPVKRRIIWSSFFHDSKIKRKEELDIQEQAERERLAKEYKEKSDYIDGYTESVKAVITNASNMKKFSVFGTSESIANINKTENDYKRIENVQVRELNSRAVEQFLKNDISIYIVLALMIYIIYNIYEYRDNGMWQIIYTAVNGRMRLAVKDTAAVGLSALFVSLIMQLCGLVSMLVVYGGWDFLTAPVQCLKGYNNFTYPISVMTYLFIRYMIISLIVIAIVLVISLVFSLCRKRISSVVLVGIIAGAEAFAYQNISMQGRLRIFKKINIINVMNVSNILRKYDNIMIAGVPVRMINVLCMVCIIIAVISAIFLVLLGKVIRPGRTAGFIGKMIEKIGHVVQRILSRLPHFWKEMYKFLITARGWIVICVVVFITIFICNNQKIAYSEDEKKRDEYYQQYGGRDYSGFTSLIEQRQNDVYEAQAKLDAAREQYEWGELSEDDVSRYVYNLMDATRLLDNMSEYMQQIEYVSQIKEQYGIDAYVMSQRGYDQIFGSKGATRKLLIYIILGFGVVLIAETESSVEYKNGMNMLIGSSKRGRRWEHTVKAAAVCILVGVSAFLLYIIEMIIMYKAYGMPYINAPLISLTYMNTAKVFRNITISQYMLILMAEEILFAVAVGLETVFASRHIFKKNSGKGIPLIIVINTAILCIIM